MSIEVKLQYSKETKRTYVYHDLTGVHPISRLYIDKRAMTDGAPESIKVEVSHD